MRSTSGITPCAPWRIAHIPTHILPATRCTASGAAPRELAPTRSLPPRPGSTGTSRCRRATAGAPRARGAAGERPPRAHGATRWADRSRRPTMPPVAATDAARSVWRDRPAHRGRRATGPARRGPRRARATGGRSSQSRLEPRAVGRADVVQGGVTREGQAVPPDRDAHPGDGPPPRVAVAPFAHHHEVRGEYVPHFERGTELVIRSEPVGERHPVACANRARRAALPQGAVPYAQLRAGVQVLRRIVRGEAREEVRRGGDARPVRDRAARPDVEGPAIGDACIQQDVRVC